MNAKLIVYSHRGKREIELVENNTIGRHPKNRIQIEDRSVSKEHSQIYMDKIHGWMIRDLGSINGTIVNNAAVEGEFSLDSGDIIFLGNVRCVFSNDASLAFKMIKLVDREPQESVYQKAHTQKDRFLPANRIDDIDVLRADYEKLRITYELQRDIGFEIDIEKILEKILERTFEFLACDRGVILLANKKGTFEPKAYKALHVGRELHISSTIIQQIEKKRTGILSSNVLIDNRFAEAESIIMEGIRSTIAVPILYQEELLGILIVDSSEVVNVFSEKDLQLLTNIANQTALYIKNSILHEELRLCFDSSIRTLSAMVDAKHPLTAGHSQRVTEYSIMIAREMGLDKKDIEVLKFAALLHDIGKIGIRDNVLLKNGSFTHEERADMDTHPLKTKIILDNFRFPSDLRDVPKIASMHHEKVNGKGYPYGLTGDKLPMISKIIVVADVFDALTAYRDYPKHFMGKIYNHEPLPLNHVVDILKNEAGSHFDKKVVKAFMKCLPRILMLHRGGYFPPEYVDDTIRAMAPELLVWSDDIGPESSIH